MSPRTSEGELRTEVLIVGGGLGGVAAALGALEAGRTVVLTEEYRWLGGQLTSQAVPMDEHTWIESFGAPPPGTARSATASATTTAATIRSPMPPGTIRT